MNDLLDPPPPKSARAKAVEAAANEFLSGAEVTEPCPDCGAPLEVVVIRPDVLVRCPNGHVDAHRRIVSDPGWSMRLGFLVAAAIILGLGLVRRYYFEGRPDPHATSYDDSVGVPPVPSVTPATTP